jgi:hypothetical protein
VPSWRALLGGCVGDLHGDKYRRRREFLLPAEQHARGYPIAPRYRGQVRAGQRSLGDHAQLVVLSERAPMTIAGGPDNGSRRQVVSHMTSSVTKGVT